MNTVFRTFLLAFCAVVGSGCLSAAVISIGPPSLVGLTEGNPFNGTVGTFLVDNPNDPASSFTVTIDWGDGTMSPGTVSGGGGTFGISGNHTYADEGTIPFGVDFKILDSQGNTTQGIGSATVGDAPLSLISNLPSFPFTSQVPVNVMFGSFSDGNPFGAASDFIATIDWGDGTQSAGTISGSPSSYLVSGMHTYSGPGNSAVSVNIADVGGSGLNFGTEALAVPEPGSLGMALIGLAAVAGLAWWRRS